MPMVPIQKCGERASAPELGLEEPRQQPVEHAEGHEPVPAERAAWTWAMVQSV
jgi:hypothetical protein